MRRWLAALTLATCAASATAGPTAPDYAAALAALQAKDSRLQSIGWRLAAGNARYCRGARLASGLLVHDVGTYDHPDAVRRASGIVGDIAVQAVAEGGPAQQAGLRPNDEIVAVSGTDVTTLASSRYTGRARTVEQFIERQLALHGQATLRLRAAAKASRDVVLHGVPACPARFEIVTGRSLAVADGERVLIGERYGDSASAADGLSDKDYTVIVAHELAHNLLAHRDRLDAAGRTAANIRRTEREADRLSVWLLINAGIAPETALDATDGWRRKRDQGLLRAPTHPGWRERREIIAAEIARVHAVLAQHGAADWSTLFQRELEQGD